MGELGQYTDGGINPEEHEPGMDFTPLPPGWYPVEVEAAEIKDTKARTGKYLKLTFIVIEDEYNGRKLFANLNIMNPSEKAQEIGRRELADIARACGIPLLDDEDKLLGCQLEVRVKVVQEAGREPDNDVKGYRQLGADGGGADTFPPARTPKPSTPAPATTPPAKTAPPAATGKMPWER